MWQSKKILRPGDFIPYLIKAKEQLAFDHKVSRWDDMIKLLCSEVSLIQKRVFDKAFKPIFCVACRVCALYWHANFSRAKQIFRMLNSECGTSHPIFFFSVFVLDRKNNLFSCFCFPNRCAKVVFQLQQFAMVL